MRSRPPGCAYTHQCCNTSGLSFSCQSLSPSDEDCLEACKGTHLLELPPRAGMQSHSPQDSRYNVKQRWLRRLKNIHHDYCCRQSADVASEGTVKSTKQLSQPAHDCAHCAEQLPFLLTSQQACMQCPDKNIQIALVSLLKLLSLHHTCSLARRSPPEVF